MDGSLGVLDAVPFISPRTGRTLVPVRFIGEVLGAAVEWLPRTRQVQIKEKGREILLTLDSDTAYIGGEPRLLDCPAVIVGGRTFVPLRFLGESLGAAVKWDKMTQMITIEG